MPRYDPCAGWELNQGPIRRRPPNSQAQEIISPSLCAVLRFSLQAGSALEVD